MTVQTGLMSRNIQDFSKKWTDEDLYKKYGLSDSEIGFINSIVKPLEW